MAGNNLDAVRRFELMTAPKGNKVGDAAASPTGKATEAKPIQQAPKAETTALPKNDAVRRFELMTGGSGSQQVSQKAPTMKELADRAEREYRNYVGSAANLQARTTAKQQYNATISAEQRLKNARMNPLGDSRYDNPEAMDPKEKELKAKMDYYMAQAQKEADDATMAADLQELESWSPVELAMLDLYNENHTGSFGNILEGLNGVLTNSGATQNAAYKNAWRAQEAYNQLVEKYGEEKVRNLAESRMRSKNKTAAEAVTEKTKEAVEGDGTAKGKWAGGAANAVGARAANLAGAFTAPIGYLSEVATRTGRYQTMDPNNLGYIPQKYAGTVDAEVAENISGDEYDEQGNKVSDGGAVRQGAAYLYQAGMSAADNIIRAAVGGGSKAVSLGLAATGSFGQTVQQASAQGASAAEATLLGTVNAALEVGTEYIPLDNLLKQAKGSPHTLKAVLKNVLLQGGIEATTEEISLFGSVLAEAAILQEKSAYNQQITDCMASGMSYQQAVQQANRSIFEEARDTLIVSWLSGSASTGAAAVQHATSSMKLGKHLMAQNLDTEDIQATINEGLASKKDSDSYRIASELQKKINSGKKLSAYDLGALYHANVAAIDEENREKPDADSAEVGEAQTEELPEVRIVENGRAVLENAYGVDVTDEQWEEAQQAAKNFGVDIKLYTDEDSDEAGYVKDGEVYINTAVRAPMADTVSRFLGNQAPAAERQNVPVTQQNVPVTQQNVPVTQQNVPVTQQNVPVTQQNVPVTQKSVPITQQATVNNKMNGGMTNGTAASTGAGVLSGGGQRNDGAGTGEQIGSLAGGAGAAAQGRRLTPEQYRIQNQRNALGAILRLPKVSSAALGIHSGTEYAGLQVIPEQYWDDSMRAKAEQVYQETGQRVTYVLGRIQIRNNAGKIMYVKGVANESGIVVQANHPASTAEQIADHEAFHGMVRAYGPKLSDQLIAQIREQYTEEEFRAVVDKYVDALRGTIDLEGAQSNAELQKRMEMILEEILADAHAGMNVFGAGATQFTDTVNRFLDENHISRRQDQENGVRETNGPPAQAEKNTADEGGERFSFAGEHALTANSQTLGEAQEMEQMGADMETIRQQTGWFRGKDGKWRFEVDDSTAQLAENISNYMTLGQLLPGAEIFKAYPNMEDVSVVFQSLDPGVNASYDTRFDTIDVNYKLKNDPEAVRSAVLHEMQHVIQRWEGFSKGTNVRAWEKKIKAGFDARKSSDIRDAEEAERKIEQYRQEDPMLYRDVVNLDAMAPDLPRGAVNWDTLEQIEEDPPEWKAFDARRDELEEIYGDKMWDFWSALSDLEKINKRPARTAEELYWDTAGEIEARNVAGRRNLTAEERKKTPPILGGEDTVFAEGDNIPADYVGKTADGIEVYKTSEAVKKLPWKERKKLFLNLMKNQFRGRTAKFVRNGHPYYARFEPGDVNKNIYGDEDSDDAGKDARTNVGADGNIFELVENSKYWKSKPESGKSNKMHRNVKYWDYFVKTVQIDGKVFDLIANVRKRPDGNFVYAIEMHENKEIEPSSPEGSQNSVLNGVPNSSTFNIHEQMGVVKESFSADDLDEEEYARRQAQYTQHTKDSNGYDLSSQQQEYFADSKARDDNGRLLVLYHQTDGDFTVFDTRHPGAGTRDGGTPFGIFMKRSGRDIGLAGKKQMALYANITNPIRATDREDLNRQLRNISSRYAEIDDRHKAIDAEYHDKYEKAGQAWNDYIAEWRKANPNASRKAIYDDPKFNELFNAEDAVLEEWQEVSDKLSMQAKEAITEDLRKAGYDGIFLENDAGSWGRKTDAVIALDPEQVKSITNKSPTTDHDIRYAVDDLDEEEYARRQEQGYQGKAPTQQELEQERQAWLQKEYNEKNRKKENKPTIAKRELKKTMMSLFSIPEGVKAETGMIIDAYAERLLKNGALTEDDRTAFFDRMYSAGVMNVPADEYLAQGRSYLLKSRIYVPEQVRAEFGDDWERIRRRAFGNGIYLTKDRHDSGIDVWNHDLASEDMLPGLFNSEDTDLRSILERIVQVAEAGRDESMSLPEYTAMLAGKDYIREDEFLDQMERQMDWALRTFAQMADLEINLRDRADERVKREHEKGTERVYKYAYQDAQRRTREREDRKDMARRQRERKELQELQKKTLKQLQWLSKNRNRAPEELKGTWDEVLSDIDIYAVSAADEMRWSNKHNATWQDLAQMYKDASKNDPNFLPSPELERIVTRLDGTKIEDMDVGALQDLYKAAVGLRTEFHNRNNVVNDELNRLFAEVYTDAKREIENAPGSYTGKKGDKFLNMEQLTPMNVMQRMGGWDPDGTFYSMAKQLEKGERDIRAYSVKAKRMLSDFLTEHEDWVKKADGQGKDAIWYEVEVPQLVQLGMGDKPIFGPTVKVWMTPTQKVHMYLESKNVDNLRHMTGGRTFVNKELYSEGKRQEALAQGTTIRMAPETVKLLVSDLTEEEMELARLLEQYYNSFAAKEINRVSNILYGYDKAMGSHYAPIYTNRNYTKTEFGVFDTTAEGVGNLKGRQYAVNPSYNISALDAFERHVDQTARFVGMAVPARNWTTLMNWREKNNSTGDVITHKWGEEGKKYITDLITRLQAGEDVKTDSVSSGLSKLQSNYISAIFGANPSIVLKQLGSIPMASAYLGVKTAPSLGQIANIDRDLIGKYTQDLEWRTLGYSMPETKILKENPNWTQSNKFYGFVFGGDAITAMDGWAASVLWPWAENKVRKEHPELEVGTQAQIDAGESPFYKKVAEEFEDAVARSQSTSDEIHQSQIRKSKNPLTRAFTMFRSDSAQTYNALRQKIGEAQYFIRTGAGEEKVKAAKVAVGTAFMAMTVNAMWGEVINFLMALIKNKGKYYRNEEEELTAESVTWEMVQNMAGSYAGTVTLGEETFELIGNMLTGEKLYDIETPGMEQLNDVINVISSAGGGMRDWTAELANVMIRGGNPGQYIRQHGKEVLGHLKDIAETIAMYGFGVSASNVESYLLGTVKALSPELGTAYDDLFQTVGKRDLSGMKGNALASRIETLLGDRGLEVSDTAAKNLAGLYEAGYKSAVPSDIPSSVTIDGESKQLKPYQKQMYSNVWNSIVAGSIEELMGSEAFAAAPKKTQEKMISYLFTYASEMAKAELFEGYEPDTRDDDIEAFARVGLNTADFLIAYGKYNEIYNMDLSASEKALELAYWAEEEGYTPEQVKTIKTELAYFNMSPAASTKFDKMLDAGVDPDNAYEAVKEMNALKDEAGEEDVADVEYWRVCVKAASNEWTQAALLAGAMTQDQYKKFKRCFDLDISPDVYVRYYEHRSQFDADGNGSFTNDEVKNAIDMLMPQCNTEQKGVLWQMATGSTSTRNNPYSKDAGQRYLDAKAREKKQNP